MKRPPPRPSSRRARGVQRHALGLARPAETTTQTLNPTLRVRELEDEVLLLAYALVQERELRAFALEEIDRRFPEEPAA